MRELWEFEGLEKVAVFLHWIADLLQLFPKTKNSDGVLQTRGEPRARKRYIQQYQIWYSGLYGVVEISIRRHLDK